MGDGGWKSDSPDLDTPAAAADAAAEDSIPTAVAEEADDLLAENIGPEFLALVIGK